MSRKKKKKGVPYNDIDLNIMPFIDVFSLLNVFLLMSAVFLAIGIIEVQIPFLSNNPKVENPVDKRNFTVKVDMEKEKILVITEFTKAPREEKTETFQVTDQDISRMHQYLVELRLNHPETDKLEFFTEDDVIWKDMAKVLDAVKLRSPDDPVIPIVSDNPEDAKKASQYLYEKVVMASVML